jgi:hypothetical protein
MHKYISFLVLILLASCSLPKKPKEFEKLSDQEYQKLDESEEESEKAGMLFRSHSGKHMLHEVSITDTIVSIARQYKVDVKELAALNNLKKPYNLTPGELVKIPLAKASEQLINEQKFIDQISSNDVKLLKKKEKPETSTGEANQEADVIEEKSSAKIVKIGPKITKK